MGDLTRILTEITMEFDFPYDVFDALQRLFNSGNILQIIKSILIEKKPPITKEEIDAAVIVKHYVAAATMFNNMDNKPEGVQKLPSTDDIKNNRVVVADFKTILQKLKKLVTDQTNFSNSQTRITSKHFIDNFLKLCGNNETVAASRIRSKYGNWKQSIVGTTGNTIRIDGTLDLSNLVGNSNAPFFTNIGLINFNSIRVITGDLILSNNPDFNHELPKDLYIHGDLNLNGCVKFNIKNLAPIKHCRVLYIRDVNIKPAEYKRYFNYNDNKWDKSEPSYDFMETYSIDPDLLGNTKADVEKIIDIYKDAFGNDYHINSDLTINANIVDLSKRKLKIMPFRIKEANTLMLRQNYLTNLETLRSLERVKIFDASFNQLQDLNDLKRLTYCEHFNASNNRLLGTDIFDSIKGLKTINLSGNGSSLKEVYLPFEYKEWETIEFIDLRATDLKLFHISDKLFDKFQKEIMNTRYSRGIQLIYSKLKLPFNMTLDEFAHIVRNKKSRTEKLYQLTTHDEMDAIKSRRDYQRKEKQLATYLNKKANISNTSPTKTFTANNPITPNVPI